METPTAEATTPESDELVRFNLQIHIAKCNFTLPGLIHKLQEFVSKVDGTGFSFWNKQGTPVLTIKNVTISEIGMFNSYLPISNRQRWRNCCKGDKAPFIDIMTLSTELEVDQRVQQVYKRLSTVTFQRLMTENPSDVPFTVEQATEIFEVMQYFAFLFKASGYLHLNKLAKDLGSWLADYGPKNDCELSLLKWETNPPPKDLDEFLRTAQELTTELSNV